jgi:multimeric flavodoxin WrbA
MKVLALNSSARTGSNSKTELMLTHLVEGMRQAGAEVEIVNLREKKSMSVAVVMSVGRKHRDDVFTRTI